MIDLKQKKTVYKAITVAFAVMALLHAVDVIVAKMSVPIMDYWRWIAVYGEDVLDGRVAFADWFRSDAGQHIHPFSMMVTFSMLKAFHFDVVPLVVFGMLLRILVAFGLTAFFVLRFRAVGKDQGVFFLLSAVTVGLSVFNFSQWEAALEPFSLAFMLRIAFFYLSFYLAERFVDGMEERAAWKNLLFGALIGAYSGLLTVFASSAYFVGHLLSMGIAILWRMWCRRKAVCKYLLPVFLWGILSLAGAVVYYAIFSARADAAVPTAVFKTILPALHGVVCYFGSMVVHQTVSDFTGLGIVTVVGILLIGFSGLVTFYYIRLHKDGEKLFPLMCVLYAFLTGAVIAVGRVGAFGVGTMTSSRYVVESSVGAVGLAFMTYDVVKSLSLGVRIKKLLCGALVFSLLWLSASAVIELGTMPSRRAYSEELKGKMLAIETLADEELAPFQANAPDDVRSVVKFFKERKLSIFRE